MSYEQETILATAPIMGGAGTTTVANIGTTTADLGGTYTSDGGSPITSTGFVVYPSGNPSTIIGGANVTQFPDAILPSPISANATGLTGGTNYCFKPYAINAIGTSYGTELCFTTLNFYGYVNNNSLGTISKVDLVSNTIISSLPTGPGPRALVGQGNIIYFGNNNGEIGRINSDTFTEILPRINTGSVVSESLVILGGYLYGNVGQASGFVVKVDISSWTIVASVAVYPYPRTVTTDGTYIYCSHESNNPTAKIDPMTMSIIDNNSAGAGSFYTHIQGGFLYVGNYINSNVKKVDLSSFGTPSVIISGTYGACRDIVGLGDFLYIASYATNEVKKYQISTNTVVTALTVGTNPEGLFIENGKLFIANYGSNNAMVVDLTTFTIIGTVSGLSGPYQCLTF